MLFTVIIALLLIVVLLITASLLFSARREYVRHKQAAAAQLSLPAHPLDRHVTAILYLDAGNVVSVEKPVPAFSLSSSWHMRRRTLVSLGFLMMALLTFLYIQV